VLVRPGPQGTPLVYACAGRSSFLDGGLVLAALDPMTGEERHRTVVDGPWPDLAKDLGNGFYMDGMQNDVPVSGVDVDAVFIRQQRFSLDLNRVVVPPVTGRGVEQPLGANGKPTKLAVKPAVGQGDAPVGLHLFAMHGLLDDRLWDRSGWSFMATWPGFHFINQAPKSGQLVAWNREVCVVAQYFTERKKGLSPQHPAGSGCLVVADAIDNEPVLRDEHRNIDKAGPGFTRAAPPRWSVASPLRPAGLVIAGAVVCLAGTDERSADGGAWIHLLRLADGTRLGELRLPAAPVFDGMVAAQGRLYVALAGNRLIEIVAEP
jgi:hypothetical protein